MDWWTRESPYLAHIEAVGLALAPPQLLVAMYSARHESMIGHALAMIMYAAQIVFISLQLHGTPADISESIVGLSADRATVYAGFALPLLVVTILIGTFVCSQNFNRGLKPYLQRRRIEADTVGDRVRRSDGDDHARGESQQLESLPARLEID